MRILLDECVPARLGREPVRHEVRTVPEMGWASHENGALLALAEGEFEVFLTTDQRIIYQQAVAEFTAALVVLVARRNKIEFLLRLLPELRRVLENVKPGGVQRPGTAPRFPATRSIPALRGPVR